MQGHLRVVDLRTYEKGATFVNGEEQGNEYVFWFGGTPVWVFQRETRGKATILGGPTLNRTNKQERLHASRQVSCMHGAEFYRVARFALQKHKPGHKLCRRKDGNSLA